MRRGVIAALAVAAGAVIVTVIVAVMTAPGSRSPALPASGILAAASVDPRTALFGDTVVVRVGAVVDRRRIDPSTLALGGGFSPYAAGATSVDRREVGHVTRVLYRLSLRCLVAACLPPDPRVGGSRTFAPSGVHLDFRRTDGTRGSLLLTLSPVEVASRLTPTDAALVDDFRLALVQASPALGRVDYAVSPSLLVALLVAAAALLLGAAGWLVLRYGRFRETTAPGLPPQSPIVLSPLERALVVVERARARGFVPDERKALELLAGELGRSREAELASAAKGLAWSEPAPGPAATLALAADVRSVIERSRDGRPQ